MNPGRPGNEPQYWLPEWPRLEWDLPIDSIRPAEYNPRFLSEEAFGRLKDSIATHGMIKPIIVNGDGVILAGHQRTKALAALGATSTPAFVLTKDASADDEVQFNLTHNSVEESKVVVTIPAREQIGYHWVRSRDIVVVDKGKAAARIGKAAKLVTRHGPWGSVVADAAGRVIANAEYAATLATLRMPLLVYYTGEQAAAEVEQTLAGDFGIYDPGKAALTPYVQTMLQRFRLRNIGEEHDWRDRTQGSFRSTTWERLVLPWLTRQHRTLDFGAGRMDYTRHLRSDGYDVLAYEPFFIHVDEETRRQDGSTSRRAFDLDAIGRMVLDLERDVRRRGLLDVVVLDSVINATSSEQYQDWIFNSVAALLADDGRLCMGTLSTRDLYARNNMAKARSVRATVSYVGKDNRAVAYAHGVLYAVKYHSPETLTEALSPYFDSIEIEGTGNQLRATCTGRRALDPERTFRALLEEFDMLYPGGQRHGVHRGLITTVMRRHWPDWQAPADWPAGGVSNGEASGDNS